MGYALGVNYARQHPESEIWIADPVESQLARFAGLDVHTTTNNLEAVENAQCVIIAVKPQVLSEVVNPLASVLQSRLVISIAAGASLVTFAGLLGSEARVVRCMPNTPVLVGKGMFGLYANEHVSPAEKEEVGQIFASAGKILWVDSDEAIDAITAISGSGPAYFFRFVEALVAASKELGMSNDQAELLVQETFFGAVEMVRSSTESVGQLRANVTSPGGTTAAALDTFERLQFEKVVSDAVRAAFSRAQELAA